ncbi:PRE_C2HC domain-containing protein [Trichonephila clavipes]|uniref:PRE_C2HC domain-containing protein n=1 Tax=Trichonephila clavipes TaxID=2585209 RepID=A0A8X6WGN6_TRICX|nr:PRE_C2HC domain-containing protein [Trichonephila clavipes]
MYLRKYPVKPRKLCTCFIVVGSGNFRTASVFVGDVNAHSRRSIFLFLPLRLDLHIRQRHQQLTDDIQKYTLLCQGTESTLKSLTLYGKYNSEDPVVASLQNQLLEYTRTYNIAVSQFSSLPPCNLPGCPIHHTPSEISSQPDNFNDNGIELVKNVPQKRKENDDGFITPPLSKVNKLANCSSQLNFNIELKNKFLNLNEETAGISTDNASKNDDQNNSSQQTFKNLPPPVMLSVKKKYIEQMKEIKDKLPFVRGKLTGEYLKLYTDTQEQQHKLIYLLEVLDFEFHVIPSKADRPIKIVIKGLPRDTPLSNIQNELGTLGFTIDKVSQLTGRITKQLLPIFLVTLPRNLFNSKIFDLNKLCYLSVRVDGYDSNKGVTLCFSCNKC